MRKWLAAPTLVCALAGLFGAFGCDGEYRPYEMPDAGEVRVANTAIDQSVGSLQPHNDVTDAGESNPTCPGCVIEGVCLAPDAREPANPCHVCDPARDRLGWSSDETAVCDDGAFCTVNDVCAAGSCVGIERACDDGIECNGTSTCNELTDSCSPPLSQCGTALCDVGTDTCVSTCEGCIIDGVCISDGTEATGNPCQVCNPDVSSTAYTVAVGKNCGSLATSCSDQDTCDAQAAASPTICLRTLLAEVLLLAHATNLMRAMGLATVSSERP